MTSARESQVLHGRKSFVMFSLVIDCDFLIGTRLLFSLPVMSPCTLIFRSTGFYIFFERRLHPQPCCPPFGSYPLVGTILCRRGSPPRLLSLDYGNRGTASFRIRSWFISFRRSLFSFGYPFTFEIYRSRTGGFVFSSRIIPPYLRLIT